MIVSEATCCAGVSGSPVDFGGCLFTAASSCEGEITDGKAQASAALSDTAGSWCG